MPETNETVLPKGGATNPDSQARPSMPETTFRQLLRRLTVWLLAATLVLVLLLGGLIPYLFHSAQSVEHTNEVLVRISRVENLAVDMETGVRGYSITANRAFLEPFDRATATMPKELDELQALVHHDGRQLENVSQLRNAMGDWNTSATNVRNRVEKQIPADAALHLEGKKLMDAVRARIAAMQLHEQDLLRERAYDLARVKAVTITSVLLGGGVLAPLFILALRGSLRRVSANYRSAWSEAEREREQLRVTLSSIGDGVIATDTTGHVTFLNPVAVSLTGWPADEARGRPLTTVFDIINEYTRKPVESPVARVLREGAIVGLANHTLLLARDRRETPIADSAAPIRNQLGEITGVVLVFRDQTEERKAKHLLTEQKQVLEQIASGCAIDECLTKICETIGRLSSGARAVIHLADGERKRIARTVASDMPEALGAAIRGVAIDGECFGTCSDAMYRGEAVTCTDTERDERWSKPWRELCVSLGVRGCHSVPCLDGTGKPVGSLALLFTEPRPPTDWELKLVAFGAQVTSVALAREAAEGRLRESEERATGILRSITDSFHLIGADGRFKEFNTAAGALFAAQGLDPDTLIGKHIFNEVFPPVRQLPVGRSIQRTLTERVPTEAENFYEPWQRWYVVRNYPTPDGGVATFFQDVTERKQAEQALSEKEERLRAALSASATGTFRWNIQTNGLDWDENLDQLFGLLPGETVRSLESFIAQVHPDERAGVIERCQRCAREGADFDMEFRVVWPDGSVHWLADKGKTFFDEHGRPLYMTGACLEITGRKAGEQALRESEERYRDLFQSMDEGYCIIEILFDSGGRRAVDYRFLEVNPAFEAQAGMHDVVGKRMLEFVPCIEEHWLNNYGQVALTGEPIRFANEYKTLHRWFDVYAFRVGPPESRKVAVLFTDITQRKRSEEELRKSRERFDLVRDGAQLGFWFCDLPFDELIWDSRVKEHFWLTPEARVTIDTFYERMHPDDRERTRAAIAASIANYTRYDIEYRTVSPTDGWEKWIRAIGQGFYDAEGQPIRFDGVTLDITHSKRAEDDLRASRAELTRANEQLASRAEQLESLVQQRTARLTETIGELEGFSYSITHDMRAPLRAVNSFAQMLNEEYGAKLDEDGKRLLVRISQAVTRMDKLIQDVLQYSKVMRMDLKLEPVDANQLVQEMLESYPAFQEPKASIVIEGELPKVLANEAALTQCFSNLLNNAVKFVPAGVKPRVTVHAETKESAVRFCVQDNGIGIEPKYLENIFGLFQRLTKEYEGTGVGLSIVRKAVERMGGTAGAESEPGQGSCFWFELNRANNQSER